MATEENFALLKTELEASTLKIQHLEDEIKKIREEQLLLKHKYCPHLKITCWTRKPNTYWCGRCAADLTTEDLERLPNRDINYIY